MKSRSLDGSLTLVFDGLHLGRRDHQDAVGAEVGRHLVAVAPRGQGPLPAKLSHYARVEAGSLVLILGLGGRLALDAQNIVDHRHLKQSLNNFEADSFLFDYTFSSSGL